MTETNNSQMNGSFNSNIGGENSLGFTPPSGPEGFEPPQPVSSIPGLSENEIKDPNVIVVTVSDPAPVVVLFGAKTSGKTMALIRLTRYLEKLGYQVKPDNLFRPAYDTHYKRMCSEYFQLCHSKYAPAGNNVISFMLVKVLDSIGRPVCQLLEAPGEHYFDEKDPQKPYPTYIQQIMNLRNKKVWMFIVDQEGFNKVNNPAMSDQDMRDMYVQRINNIPPNNLRNDKVIFTCHKVDEHPEVFLRNGMPNKTQIFKNIQHDYPGIFTQFKNKIPVYNWFKKYNFESVTFSAGSFTGLEDGREIYIAGDDIYPKMLWEAILKTLGRKK